jgi:hypothetical protein
LRVDRDHPEFVRHPEGDFGRAPGSAIGWRLGQAGAQLVQEFGGQEARSRAIAPAPIPQRLGTELIVALRQLLQPALHEAGGGRDFGQGLALRQKPDRLVVPRGAGILTGASPPAQFCDTQVISDRGHVRLRETPHRP